MTDIYFAFSQSGESRLTMARLAERDYQINVLVSYVYLPVWDRLDAKPVPVRTILDSGAFSAWKSGYTINIDDLIAETKSGRWHESVTLDVIGDADASLKNALYMKEQGSPAYPVFHIGDPWEHLEEYKRQFWKVGLSCRFGEPVKQSIRWLDQCFTRAYPYRFHSFGWVKMEDMLLRFPFHSADASSWNNTPAAYGRWKAFGKMSVYGLKNLQAEVDTYLADQKLLKFR